MNQTPSAGSVGINEDVVEKQIAAMSDAGLDALVAISPENYAYLTGFVVPSQPILRWRHAATVVTADGEVGVLSVDMEATTVMDRLPGVKVDVWREFDDNAMEVLAQLLRDLGLESSRIGIETDYVPARDMDRLEKSLPKASWEPAQGTFNRLRMIKSPREVEHLRALSRITDTAIKYALSSVECGDSEFELAKAVTGELYRLGADHHKFLIVATGERSQYPNVGPTDRILAPGDLIRLEIFGVSAGYHAGVCRTGVVQEASDEARRVFTNLAACRDIVLGAMRPGVSSGEVYRRFLEKFSDLGYDPIDFVGHGIGLHLHEEPYLSRHGHTVLEEGMVFGVEPLLYGPGFGLQIKDMVAVGPNGSDLLSDVMEADQLCVVP